MFASGRMRASLSHRLFCFAAGFLLATSASFADREMSGSEQAAWSMARPLEKEGYFFRAESWEKELKPEMGKAVRVQLFKGNDYRFCIAVPMGSGVQITAAVLDIDGKPLGSCRPSSRAGALCCPSSRSARALTPWRSARRTKAR